MSMVGLLCIMVALSVLSNTVGIPPVRSTPHIRGANTHCVLPSSFPSQRGSGALQFISDGPSVSGSYSRQVTTLALRGGGGEGTGWGAWKALTTPKIPAPPRDPTPDAELTPGPKRSTTARSLARFGRTPAGQTPQDSSASQLPSAASAWSAARARADFSREIEDGDIVVPGHCNTLRQALQRVGSGRRVLLRAGVECKLSSGLKVRCRKRQDTPGQRAVHVSGKWTDADERAEVGSEERGAEQGRAEQGQMGGRQKEGGGATTRRGAVQRRAEQAQARQQEEAEASVVWGAWLLGEGVGGTVCGVTLGLASEAEQRRHTQDGVANVLMDIQGGEWAIKDVMFCPMRTCAMRIKTDGNVSMYNCLVRGIPPDHPAADGIVCLNRAKLVMEECTFQFVGIEVADVKGGVFCGNLTAMMQRANEFDQQMRRKQTHDDDDDDEDEEDPDPGVDGTVKTRGFRRFGMLDPGVVAGSTRGIGVSFFQSSSGTILSCRFLKCGIGVDVGDSAHVSVVSNQFHDTEYAFRADEECDTAGLAASSNKITGEGKRWFNERRPGRLREQNNECEQDRRERDEFEAMIRQVKDLEEWHAPADLREPFLEHFGEEAKDFADELIWDVSREEAERQLGPKIQKELAEIEERVRKDLQKRLPVFKEFSIFMPTLNGDPIPGDLGHLEVDPEEEIARALAIEEEEGESSDGIGPMPSLDAP